MRYSLEVDPEIDFEMIGLSSHLRDYKLCWQLNRHLGMNLSRSAPLQYKFSRQNEVAEHARFIWFDDVNHTSYHLVKNKSDQGLIVPEFKHADYLIFVRDNIHINFTELISGIRKIDNVLMAQKIDVKQLKNVEQLMYLEFETN
jgi:hypothetical protein